MNGANDLKLAGSLALAGLALALAGCDREEAPVEPAPAASGEPKSIFRPEFRPEPVEEVLEPLEETIFFPEGAGLDEAARETLGDMLGSPQFESGGAIVLRGHSDAGGSDEVNLRISRERAEAVRDWLVEYGVDEERIAVIAFGEQNPAEPNALPDGTPDEEGRAANRRVDITVEVKAGDDANAEEPTLAETLADPEEGDEDKPVLQAD